MDPLVVAAIITGALTVIGTLLAQHFGRLATGRDTEKTLNEQSKQLDKTFAEQREELDKTLKAQSEQLDRTLAEQRTRTLNERFATAADELGSGKPAVRLAGVYALAGLADDWPENRQACVAVLCSYLRLPYERDPGDDAPAEKRVAFLASREVRHAIIGVIAAHLQVNAKPSWQGLRFDFKGVVFDGGDFSGADFSSGTTADFSGAEFSGGVVNFGSRFTGGVVNFRGANFSGGKVSFGWARFRDSPVSFSTAEFSGSEVSFDRAIFSGGTVDLGFAEFRSGLVDFRDAKFSDSGMVSFFRANFSGGTVSFCHTRFAGGTVSFERAQFSGAQVDFSDAGDWSVPPEFPWTGAAPPGVKLPEEKDHSQV
jgi:hypothetical protein